MITGPQGELMLREFPSGDVYGMHVELVSHTVATGAVHIIATVTGVRYDVWGTPRPISAERDELVVTRARLWTAPPKRAPRRRPTTPAAVAAAPASTPEKAA